MNAALTRRLKGRQEAGLLRHLARPQGLDLTSNDFLGLARSPELKQAVREAVETFGAGFGASRLLRGNPPVIEAVEEALADFCQQPAALIFSSGYAANVGLISALVGEGDVVFSDALNHASLIDGMRLSRGQTQVFRHQDLTHLDTLLAQPVQGRRFIVVESIYSMDGDLSPLQALCDLADSRDAVLIVDEAHGTGSFGAFGAGRVEALGLSQRVLATVHTGGKGLGVGGAWVASSQQLIDLLVNHARSFIFSTAPVPALVLGLAASIKLVATQPDRRTRLWANVAHLRDGLVRRGFDLGRTASHIIPVAVGSSDAAMSLAEAIRSQGFDVRAVRPPTVPVGTSRLRLTVREGLTFEQLDAFVEALVEAWVATFGELPT